MLKLTSVSKRFKDNEPWVIKNIDITITDGSIFCLLGPSGCGKSTILNLISGFENVNEGTVHYGNSSIVGPGPERFMIFQESSSALFSWLNVKENVEFGLKVQGKKKNERKTISEHYIEMVGLNSHQSKFPDELSGGMKQRLQLARALVLEPEVLLMDEPFGALDSMTRKKLQRALRNIWEKTKKTIIFVTHDIEESIYLGTHIAVMTSPPEATIKKEIECKVSEPRDPSNPEFGILYKSIENLIRDEIVIE